MSQKKLFFFFFFIQSPFSYRGNGDEVHALRGDACGQCLGCGRCWPCRLASAGSCLPLAGVRTTARGAVVPCCPMGCPCCRASTLAGCCARDSLGLEMAVLSVCLKWVLQSVLSLEVELVPVQTKLMFVQVSADAASHLKGLETPGSGVFRVSFCSCPCSASLPTG